MNLADQEDFRYERKFVVRNMSRWQAEPLILQNPAGFKPLHTPRTINNIYFDDPGFSFFKDNVEGDSRRHKVRIRWYGDDLDQISNPVLEIKSKINQVGSKIRFPVENFSLSMLSDPEQIDRWLEKCASYSPLLQYVGTLRPTIINRYRRSYYLSFDNKFRLTMDDNLEFFHPAAKINPTYGDLWEDRSIVIELKYERSADFQAREISNAFPFRLSKMSKYVAGVYQLYMT
jgi:hypothetical protein